MPAASVAALPALVSAATALASAASAFATAPSALVSAATALASAATALSSAAFAASLASPAFANASAASVAVATKAQRLMRIASLPAHGWLIVADAAGSGVCHGFGFRLPRRRWDRLPRLLAGICPDWLDRQLVGLSHAGVWPRLSFAALNRLGVISNSCWLASAASVYRSQQHSAG